MMGITADPIKLDYSDFHCLEIGLISQGSAIIFSSRN